MRQPFPFLALATLLACQVPALAQNSPPPPRAGGAVSALVDAVRADDTAAVRRLSEAAGATGLRLATWEILRAGLAEDFDTYIAFDAGHDHWPGMQLLRRRAEARMAGAPARDVLDWFAETAPQTPEGALALLAAQEASGQDPSDTLRQLWLEHDLTEAQEAALLASHGAALAPWHEERLANLLWRDARNQAERMMDRVSEGARLLARARLALQARADGVNALIDSVPAPYASDPGLAFDRFYWRLNRGLTDSAADLLRERSPDRLGRPDRWAAQRARLARRAMSDGDYRLAYDLASQHGLTEGVRLADLEWLAGFVALRFLDRPGDAARHFARLRERVSSPISLGRAGYWEGRAHEAGGNADAARAAYEFGALYQTAFYGQLSAERLGQTLDPVLISDPAYPDWRDTTLAGNDLFEAALLLYRTGDWYEARRFTLHLASLLETEAELGALSRFWLDRGEPNFALKIAKQAVEAGILLPRAYFPLMPLLAEADLRASADLTLAIARRESEFDYRAISHADARGLMQVLPATGAHTARRIGIDFDEARLTRDPAFNAALGAAYLEELSEQFDGTLSLIAAGYNAGPGRPVRWMRENGDPRQDRVDPIDWVEMIPFSETRNYVMRVTESVVIYRAILAGQAGPIGLTDMLRGRD